jgi:hypothetical protein
MDPVFEKFIQSVCWATSVREKKNSIADKPIFITRELYDFTVNIVENFVRCSLVAFKLPLPPGGGGRGRGYWRSSLEGQGRGKVKSEK